MITAVGLTQGPRSRAWQPALKGLMMSVLIVYASKHGSTREIAEAIGRELRASGLATEVHDVANVEWPEEIDAIVLGSAIYVGQWQKSAVAFIDQHQDTLRTYPLWLFSSGPIGEDLFPREEPSATRELVDRTGARDYRSFPGKLDRARLGFGERLVSRVVRAPEGDFRRWEEIRSWAREIAAALTGSAPEGGDVTSAPLLEQQRHGGARS